MVMARTGYAVSTPLSVFDVRDGDYRLVNLPYGKHCYPDYDKVPILMAKFVKVLQKKMKSVSGIEKAYELSFDAHYELFHINPFGEGNGRTARLLMNYIQAYNNLPLTTVLVEDRQAYVDALIKTHELQKLDPIRAFMVGQACKCLTQ